MKFDKEIFLDYFKNGDLSESDKIYIYRLYKTFNLVNSITNGQIEENKIQLRQFENKIYNINGVVFSESEKLKFSLDTVCDALKKMNKENNQHDSLYTEIETIKELDLRDDKNIGYAKKKISIMQAKLGLNNTFFYEACQAFEEIYTNGLITYLDRKSVR